MSLQKRRCVRSAKEKLGWKVLRMLHWKKIEYDKLEDEEKMRMWANELGKSGVSPRM